MDLIIELQIYNKINNVVLIACDSDFVPVINYLKQIDKTVHLVYYNDYKRNSMFAVSNEIEKACESKLLLEKEHFEKSKL